MDSRHNIKLNVIKGTKIQTTLKAADTQRLSSVQREAVMAVLDVRLAGHGIEIGLQGELHVVASGLHLREEIQHRMTQYDKFAVQGET